MLTQPGGELRAFDGPATYMIVVDGLVARDLSDRLQGMAISQSVETGATRSILIGELLDQAALAGVLDSLYELHFTLIAVERLAADEEPWPPPTQGK